MPVVACAWVRRFGLFAAFFAKLPRRWRSDCSRRRFSLIRAPDGMSSLHCGHAKLSPLGRISSKHVVHKSCAPLHGKMRGIRRSTSYASRQTTHSSAIDSAMEGCRLTRARVGLARARPNLFSSDVAAARPLQNIVLPKLNRYCNLLVAVAVLRCDSGSGW